MTEQNTQLNFFGYEPPFPVWDLAVSARIYTIPDRVKHQFHDMETVAASHTDPDVGRVLNLILDNVVSPGPIYTRLFAHVDYTRFTRVVWYEDTNRVVVIVPLHIYWQDEGSANSDPAILHFVPVVSYSWMSAEPREEAHSYTTKLRKAIQACVKPGVLGSPPVMLEGFPSEIEYEE